MMEPNFRSMKLEDIEQISQIEKETFSTPWTKDAFHNELVHNQFSYYIVMEHDGEIIGYGGMWTIMDEAHITNIALREQYRGQKLGELLMKGLMVKAIKLGMRRMTLEVRVSNGIAQKLYEKLDFRAAGVRKGYYTDNCEDALIMWADLDIDKLATQDSGRNSNEQMPNSGY